MIKRLLPGTSYERESLLKAFFLFFVSIEILLGAIYFLIYRIEMVDLRGRIFLEMKNYSYTFKGEKFEIKVVPAKTYGNRFYEVLETSDGLSIMIPVPGSKEDALLIYYPWQKFEFDRSAIAYKTFLMFMSSSFISLLVSFVFALYSLNPLIKALQMLEEVTKDIIHDLNTPLMTLLVNLKLLSKRYRDEEVERALMAVRQLERLRENLSPLEERRLEMKRIDLRSFIEGIISDLKKLYPQVEVKTELREVRLEADPSAVERVLSNVLENAFKHNLKGGWVKVRLNEKELVVENTSKELKNPSRVFERYYRESQRGLGLGLTIVKKLCSELGWKVRVSYRKGIFRLEIEW